MISYTNFLENLDKVKDEIAEACQEAKRSPESVLLLPVTKTFSFEAVEYVKKAGLNSVAENRVQEAVDKQGKVHDKLNWELIGHLQSNKIALALRTFNRIQSVDSSELMLKLNSLSKKIGKVFPILLQVNVSDDPHKYGIKCEDVDRLMEVGLDLKNIRLEGLMTIPRLSEDLRVAEYAFNRLREIRDKLKDKFNIKLTELSMGMSNDFIQAIKAGSTIVRLGNRLFGKRE